MEFLWRAPDDVEFPCERWMPPGPPRGLVFCVHGLSGAATDFIPFAEAVNRAGFAVLAINVRGQGHDPDPTQRGADLDLAAVEADLTAFARAAMAEFPGTPVFWCGESMGALLVSHLLASAHFSLPVAGAILSVPVVELHKPTHPIVRQLLRVCARVIPSTRFHPSFFVNGKSEPLKITRDEEYALRARNSSYTIKAFTFRFLNNFGNLMESSYSLAARLRVPVLVLAAGQDVFITAPQIQAWVDHLATNDKTLHVYPEAYHVLWNDWDREIVLADIVSWLEPRVEA